MVTYTKEVIDDCILVYKAQPNLDTVALLAAKYDCSPRSIISKLSSLGVYQKKQYLNKRGEPPQRKEAYIEELAKTLQIDPQLLESLEKCTKTCLTKILEKVQELKNPQ